jgi:malic enzyme
VYIFPAIGHAAVATRARSLPDEVFVVAAEQLAGMTTPEDVETGRCARGGACRAWRRTVPNGVGRVPPPPARLHRHLASSLTPTRPTPPPLQTTPPRRPPRLFPPFSTIRSVSARVAARVAAFAVERGLAACPVALRPGAGEDEWAAHFTRSMWGAEAPARSKL